MKRLAIFIMLILASLIVRAPSIKTVKAVYDPVTGFDDEIFFAHNWSLQYEDTSEYYTTTPGGTPRDFLTGVTVTDCQPAVSPWNASNPWGAGNTSIVMYEYEFKFIDLINNGAPPVMLQDEVDGFTPGAVCLEKYNSTHYRLRIGRMRNYRVIGLSFTLQKNHYYRVRQYGALNRSSLYYRMYALIYDEYGTLIGNKSGSYGHSSARLNGEFNLKILDQDGMVHYVRNLRVWMPTYFSPPPSDPLGEVWVTENRLMIMILFLGLGCFLAPPSYIAYAKPDAQTTILLLFVMVVGLGFLLAVAHFTPT